MKYVYQLRTDTFQNENGKDITVYGVDCMSEGKILLSVEDIFFDLHKAEAFVNLCNDVNLLPAYLETMAKNAVEEQYCTAQ